MKKVIIYTDGGSRGNPGKAAIGVVYMDQTGQIVKKFGEYLGDGLTNNEAEYRAVIFALKNFAKVFGESVAKETDVQVRSDSQLLVNQVNGDFKIKNERIKIFVAEINQLKKEFLGTEFVSIPREQNKEADKMVNEALDKQMAGI